MVVRVAGGSRRRESAKESDNGFGEWIRIMDLDTAHGALIGNPRGEGLGVNGGQSLAEAIG